VHALPAAGPIPRSPMRRKFGWLEKDNRSPLEAWRRRPRSLFHPGVVPALYIMCGTGLAASPWSGTQHSPCYRAGESVGG